MNASEGFVSQDDVAYFLNLAVIGGTLVGLTLISLGFFLVDLLKRYEGTALPVFRHRNRNQFPSFVGAKNAPHSLTDFELLDGDPLVVFIAYSVAVTWNLFLIPLTIGLTVAWGGTRLWVVALEMIAFSGTLIYSFWIRNIKIAELKPYLTREEKWWPLFGGIGLAILVISALVLLVGALSNVSTIVARIAFWNQWGVPNGHAAIFLLKTTCLLSLLLGTYTTNKDMFIFFKTMAAERMRQRWLHSFVQGTYQSLSERVARALECLPAESRAVGRLAQVWNRGFPESISAHEALQDAGPVWNQIVSRRSGAAAWMLDVPGIAVWAAQVEDSLDVCESELRSQPSDKTNVGKPTIPPA